MIFIRFEIRCKELSEKSYKKLVDIDGIVFRKTNSFKSILNNVYTEITNQIKSPYVIKMIKVSFYQEK